MALKARVTMIVNPTPPSAPAADRLLATASIVAQVKARTNGVVSLGGCDCNNSTQIVSALAGSIVTTIDFGVTSISSTKATKTTATTTPTSDSTTTTTTPPSTTAGKETTTDGGAAAGETTGGTAGQTAGASPTETPTSEKSKSNALPIGVGVGVGGAAAIALAGLIFFFMRRRKQQVAAAQMMGPEPKYTAAAPGPQYEMPARGGNAAELPAAPHPIEYYQELPAGR
ncbi:hypothetical protein VE02_09216 [Pseudogymnoascus sp. 03VT05]|nr:hypothetical protein VE02_09216 [Pseudogymnoascus sp. 03VT05]